MQSFIPTFARRIAMIARTNCDQLQRFLNGPKLRTEWLDDDCTPSRRAAWKRRLNAQPFRVVAER
jgi:hypothetical protein